MERNIRSANLQNFATELSMVIGQTITIEHIHPTTKGRWYYTQAPEPGAPMLLHHYRGPFFVDIHPNDFEEIAIGEVSANEYIDSANWQVGYYWGGGNMISGGYYQPLDIIARNHNVRRYLQILVCRGYRRACGYMPSQEQCDNCSLDSCPFSQYKTGGSWDLEIPEYDPRVDLFMSLCKRFKQDYPDYEIKGFCCSDDVPEQVIWLNPNEHFIEDTPYSFTIFVSSKLIKSLLMHTIEPSWSTYARSFEFRIKKALDPQTYEVNDETLNKAFEGLDYVVSPKEEISEKKMPLLLRMAYFFKGN